MDHFQTADGRDYGVKASRLSAFHAEFPDARCVGMATCPCQEQHRLSRVWRTAEIPKHRRHCTFEAFDSLPDDLKEGKTEGRFYAGEMAQAAMMIYQGREASSLTLSGEPGVGKSGMMACVARCWLERGENVLWVDFGEFITAIRDSYDDDSPASTREIVESAQKVALLCLDDFGDMARGGKSVTDHTRERTYDVIRYRYEYELPTMITTNLTGDQIYGQFGARIADRITEVSHLVMMYPPNLRFA